jgi:ectoine hydroxylase-related dioxygenase (phytanoyl-CoA dioxygenase family)
VTHELSAAEREAYARDGFVMRAAIFSRAEVAALCDAAEQIVRSAEAALPGASHYAIDGNCYADARIGELATTLQLEHAPGSRTLRVIEPFCALHPRFEALLDDARVVAPMRALVGADEVALFTDKLNLKRPREGSGFSWHQDSPYWAHFCSHLDQLPNVLITLDDAHEGNGCFRVIRGSHARGILPGRQGEGRLGPLFTHPSAFDASDQVPAILPAGSVVFFSPHTVHGSEPNASDAPRRAIVLTYQPAGLRTFKVDRVRDCGSRAPANSPSASSTP